MVINNDVAWPVACTVAPSNQASRLPWFGTDPVSEGAVSVAISEVTSEVVPVTVVIFRTVGAVSVVVDESVWPVTTALKNTIIPRLQASMRRMVSPCETVCTDVAASADTRRSRVIVRGQGVLTNSTRRLFAFPSGVSFDAIGFVAPYPFVLSRAASMP